MKTQLSIKGNVTCFRSNPLDCTLLARWDEGYQDPWLIVTDLEPKQSNALWYGCRSWIESSYRDVKSDGWQWHKTRRIGADTVNPAKTPTRLALTKGRE